MKLQFVIVTGIKTLFIIFNREEREDRIYFLRVYEASVVVAIALSLFEQPPCEQPSRSIKISKDKKKKKKEHNPLPNNNSISTSFSESLTGISFYIRSLSSRLWRNKDPSSLPFQLFCHCRATTSCIHLITTTNNNVITLQR